MANETREGKLLQGVREAAAVAKGEQPAARLHVNGHAYVPEVRLKEAEKERDRLDAEAGTLGSMLKKQYAKTEEMKDALRPFAGVCDGLETDAPDFDDSFPVMVNARVLNLGNFRRARTTLEAGE